MAPLPLSLLSPRRHTSYQSSGVSSGAPISGGVIGAIVVVALIIFVCIIFYEYKKAARVRAQTGRPIKGGKILMNAILIALTFGLVACCCASCLGDGNGSAGNAGGGGGGGGGGGTVADQPGMTQPMNMGMDTPQWQPQMDNTPIENAAVDPIQG